MDAFLTGAGLYLAYLVISLIAAPSAPRRTVRRLKPYVAPDGYTPPTGPWKEAPAPRLLLLGRPEGTRAPACASLPDYADRLASPSS